MNEVRVGCDSCGDSDKFAIRIAFGDTMEFECKCGWTTRLKIKYISGPYEDDTTVPKDKG